MYNVPWWIMDKKTWNENEKHRNTAHLDFMWTLKLTTLSDWPLLLIKFLFSFYLLCRDRSPLRHLSSSSLSLPSLYLSLPSARSLSLLTYSIFQPCFPAVSSTTFWPTCHFLPGPMIKACRTALPWAVERGREGWGDWGEELEEEMDRQGIWHTGGNGRIT